METKRQSIDEFLESLQKEYFVNDLRIMISTNEESKERFQKLREYKRQKIHDICVKNKRKNIFNDTELFEKYHDMIYVVKGFPAFLREEEMSRYFRNGSPVIADFDGDMLDGIVEKFYYKQKSCLIKFNNQRKREYDVFDITRKF